MAILAKAKMKQTSGVRNVPGVFFATEEASGTCFRWRPTGAVNRRSYSSKATRLGEGRWIEGFITARNPNSRPLVILPFSLSIQGLRSSAGLSLHALGFYGVKKLEIKHHNHWVSTEISHKSRSSILYPIRFWGQEKAIGQPR